MIKTTAWLISTNYTGSNLLIRLLIPLQNSRYYCRSKNYWTLWGFESGLRQKIPIIKMKYDVFYVQPLTYFFWPITRALLVWKITLIIDVISCLRSRRSTIKNALIPSFYNKCRYYPIKDRTESKFIGIKNGTFL